jgi:hypothetical protein
MTDAVRPRSREPRQGYFANSTNPPAPMVPPSAGDVAAQPDDSNTGMMPV